jgi:hypothetical protein
MDAPKDMSVPRIIIITAAVGHRTRLPTTYPNLPTTYPNRAQWEATVAGTNNAELQIIELRADRSWATGADVFAFPDDARSRRAQIKWTWDGTFDGLRAINLGYMY